MPAWDTREFSFYRDFTLRGDLSRSVRPGPEPMTFTTHGYSVTPFYLGDTAAYHGYFTRSEPQVVFGQIDSGVPNIPRADGLTFLDLVWAHAPFATRGQFVQTVQRTATTWVDSGLFTQRQRQDVITAAARADLRP
jgi:uncharacterized protein